MTLARASVITLFTSLALVTCGGTTTIDTGTSFDFADATEEEARAVLEMAVRQECARSSLGISGLASALRRTERAPATRLQDSWEFLFDGKTAQVFPTGRVSGELLRALISLC